MNFGKRGQSALEYLMTYGWALVVIVIAVAALVVLINPNTIQGDQCDSKFGQFTVNQNDVNSTGARLVLVNQTGQAVTFTGVAIAGTDGGAVTYTPGAITYSVAGSSTNSINANATGTLNVLQATAMATGQYNLTYTLTYTAGQLTGVTASGSCRGTI